MKKKQTSAPVVFNLGDIVEWSSQAQGYTKVKQGVVAGIVPAGERPDREAFADLYRGPGAGFGRKDVSYVVRVGRSKHYWPVTKNLRAAADDATAEATA